MLTRKLFLVAAGAAVLFGCCECETAKVAPEKVKIGIAWRADQDSEFLTNVKRSIEAAGGEAVILGQVRSTEFAYENGLVTKAIVDANDYIVPAAAGKVKAKGYLKSNAKEVLGDIKAVVFTGGEDVSPTLYAKPVAWHAIMDEKDYNVTRDINDYLLMAHCLDNGVAVLGICRGAQMLGIISGATVVQDIPAYYKSLGKAYDNTHRNVKATPDSYRDYSSHVVKATPGSIFAGIIGGDAIAGCPSWHHQMIASVEGTALKVTGVTPVAGIDTIETVERTDKKFAVGIQFHPEAAAVKNFDHAANAGKYMPTEKALAFFRALIAAAK